MLSLRRLALLALALLALGILPLAAQGGPYRAYLPQLSGPPLAPRDLDGVWSGLTADGLPIGFTVAAGRITRLSYAYQIGGCGLEAEVEFGTPLAIVGAAFSFSQAIPGQAAVSIAGSFSTSRSASGTLQVGGSQCGDESLRWQAARGLPGATSTPTRTGTPTPSVTLTPTSSPTTSPALTAQVRLINHTGGTLSFDLSGPTARSGSMFTGQTLTMDVAPGVYTLDATGWCGSATDVFRISSGERRELTYTCGGGAAPGLVME